MAVLSLSQISKDFTVGVRPLFKPQRRLRALRDVTLELDRGDIVAVVGESGCGKSTLARIAAGVMDPTSGSIRIQGTDLKDVSRTKARELRRSVQIVHQDPYAALNPTMTVYQTLSAPLLIHRMVPKGQVQARVVELLRMVGLNERHLQKYPNELSGGQRQRVVLARAFTVRPDVIVADEAVSAIDVSMRQTILSVMQRIHDEEGTAYLFITHDLGLARYFAHSGTLAVMYAGRVMEYGETEAVIKGPRHPYTAILRQAVPDPDPEVNQPQDLIPVRSTELPDLTQEQTGCAFSTRCPFAVDRCLSEVPVLRPVGPGAGNPVFVACHRAEELDLPQEEADVELA